MTGIIIKPEMKILIFIITKIKWDKHETSLLSQDRKVAIVVTHTKFDPATFEYDLALLRFHEPVKFQ